MRALCRVCRAGAPGFTLIELLVVVSVIALLLAILLPSLRKARQAAQAAKCQAQLHVLGQAWHDYLSDFGGRFLQGANYNVNCGGRQGDGSPMYRVSKPLNRYVKLPDVVYEGAEVFFCPADRGSSAYRPSYYAYFGSSYMTNPMLIGQNQIYINPWGDPCAQLKYKINKRLANMNMSRIGGDGKLILMGDAGWVKTWESNVTEKVDWHGRPGVHNIAFMDGHVALTRIRKGLHTTADYTVIPFLDLRDEACGCQKEVTGP